MKIEAKTRLEATIEGRETKTLDLKIECSGDVYQTLVNLLGVIQWNCNVGHSAVVGAFFDGDGADKLKITGLPDGDYDEIGEALSSYGDGFMALVGPNSATAYNGQHQDNDKQLVSRKTVWPKEDNT